MQFLRIVGAICLGWMASLSLQGCGGGDEEVVTAEDGTTNTTLTETMTTTMTTTATTTA
eukprot:CAMPEP_0114663080 /NCGR_PEP_ID=MMETSP0191-20121206/26211_1 /TAXON_ID=126664 /ORGANISM="Sorites sp." /LENGTH=58 /DNA_ID=CAMNT_0001901387 /DNA_START=62 /DNA_END=238 /DNA_ORIENTATION=+